MSKNYNENHYSVNRVTLQDSANQSQDAKRKSYIQSHDHRNTHVVNTVRSVRSLTDHQLDAILDSLAGHDEIAYTPDGMEEN